jgi:tRNA-2-methylthio-N6-dimethylallyladenosine synthase
MNCTLPKKNLCPKTLDKTFFDNLPINVKQIGKNKTYFVKTYGCLANVRDSQLIKGILNNLGFKEVND